VCQSICGGTGSGIGTREKPLTAASSRFQQVRSEPHFQFSFTAEEELLVQISKATTIIGKSIQRDKPQ
jgi:hypothetical protein